MANSTLTNTKIKDTYVGVLHAGGVVLPSTGQSIIYDGGGNKSALSVGRSLSGITVSGPISGRGDITGPAINIHTNQINSGAGTDTQLSLNFTSHNNTNKTLDTVIYDGNGASVASFTGSSKSLTVVGSVQANTFNATSSIRFKENLQPIKNALEIVQKLGGVTFNWKETGKHDTGLIAEEVEKVAPDFVLKDEDGIPVAIDYGRITSVLIEAIKELAIIVKSK